MRTFDLTPLYRTAIGIDRLANQLNAAEAPTYPPYNVELVAEDKYRIVMALAGFDRSELDINTERDAARASLTAAGASVRSQQGTYVMTAPFSGTVVARDAVPGRQVGAGQTLVQIADLDTMWALLEVPEADAGMVRAGQRVTLSFESMPGETREATLTRVGASVDPATRTVRARVELPNPDGALKAGLFLRARVQVTAEQESVLVPREAIQRAEGRALVFVKKGAGLYEPVVVELGAGTREEVAVVKGLSAGAEVVTTGAFLLKTEILKESIGAGCCETEGGE